ncbi:MAG: response regulator [Acidobacteriota bacterium]|jgi:CheY-like chemotaxis protein/HPt (histidine-containing phosphotransfer) domain-containing protein|nr:response regulator [Acidobacteriota bacterium]
MKILLAEDGDLNQKLVSRMLQKMGHECDIAADGREALAAVRTGCYDAVLMDGQMPEMDGYEATRGIRELERSDGRAHVPIIALTGGGSQEDIDACLGAGMDDHIPKPISFKLLEEKLQKYDKRGAGGRADGVRSAPGAPAAAPAPAAHAGGEVDMREEIIKDIVSGLNLPQAVAQKLLGEYLKSLPDDVAKLGDAIGGGDYPAAAKLAHSIKGASGNLRINKIFRLAGELEQVLKGADGAAPKENAPALFGELQDLVKQLA